jgi:hypothetical protein
MSLSMNFDFLNQNMLLLKTLSRNMSKKGTTQSYLVWNRFFVLMFSYTWEKWETYRNLDYFRINAHLLKSNIISHFPLLL